MATVGTISGKLVLNIGDWKKGINQSLATTKVFQRDVNKIFKSVRTDANNYTRSIHTLRAAFTQGKIGSLEYLQALKQHKQAFAAALPGTTRLERATESYQADVLRLKQAHQAGAITLAQYTARLGRTRAAFLATSLPATKLTLALRAQSIALGVLKTSLLAYAGPLAVVFAIFKTFKVSEDIEREMNASLAIMKGVTADMREEMKRTAIDVARNTIVSTKEAAKSYFFLASAGKNAAQSVALLPKVATFAQAGAFDMAQATDLLTDAQSALGLTSKDVAKDIKNLTLVSDLLVGANTLANASVEQFSLALTAKAGSAIKAYNIELEDGLAVLAAYADQNVKAELAGNAFGRFVRLLTKAVRDNAKEFKRLNIEVFDEGEFRQFADIIGDIEVALRNMTTEEKSAALETLGFKARIQAVILPLLGTSERIREYRQELKKMGGITEQVAGDQMTDFQKGWENLAGSISEAAGGLQDFTDNLGEAMGHTGDFLNMLNELGRPGLITEDIDARAFDRLTKQFKDIQPVRLRFLVGEPEGAVTLGGPERAEKERIRFTFRQLQLSEKLRAENKKAAEAQDALNKSTEDFAGDLKDSNSGLADSEKAAERAADAAQKFIDKLRFDEATKDLTALEKQLKKIIDALPEVSKLRKEAAKAVADTQLRLDAQTAREDRKKAAKAWADALESATKKTLDDAAALTAKLAKNIMTPTEQTLDTFRKTMEDLQKFRDVGALTPEAFAMGQRGARGEALQGLAGRDRGSFLAERLVAGSAEAFRATFGEQAKNEELEALQEQIRQTEEQLRLDRDRNAILRRGNVAVVEPPP